MCKKIFANDNPPNPAAAPAPETRSAKALLYGIVGLFWVSRLFGGEWPWKSRSV